MCSSYLSLVTGCYKVQHLGRLKSQVWNHHQKVFSLILEIHNGIARERNQRVNVNILYYFSYSLSNPDKATLDKTENVFPEYGIDNIVVTKVGSANVDIPMYFTPNGDPWSFAWGDSHFQQMVVDYPSQMTKSLCYDITGSPGEYLYIAGFSLNGIQVYGQLIDDHYMHRIIFKFDSGRITISTNNIIFDNEQPVNWIADLQKFTFKSKKFEYLITRNHIFIKSLVYPGNIIQIQKSIHSLSEIHLDVSFKLSPKDYKQMDGLIGDIGKKNLIFTQKFNLMGKLDQSLFQLMLITT
ncbi:DgyrCDS14389 [Dimorphilus gyrociliatus]|uniref:DgyrCDS14389 n=1 Tax=Dimorphilus gyrociliatus TaxID=2664684 RepID=A0A7I8WDF7_9ANNE|nr:DgyrCDS14389 [Dimorphilus gyrociliatus]